MFEKLANYMLRVQIIFVRIMIFFISIFENQLFVKFLKEKVLSLHVV